MSDTLTDTQREKTGSAPFAGLRGQDTRLTYTLKDSDGQPLRAPSLEQSVYLIACELLKIRLDLREMKELMHRQGGR